MDSSTYGNGEERARILRMVEAGTLSAAEAINLLDRLGKANTAPYEAGAAAYSPQMEDVPDEDYAQQGLPPVQPAESAPQPTPGEPRNGEPRWLRVRVTDLHSGRSKVSVSIPFKLASWGLRAGARFGPQVEGIDLTELSRVVQQGGANGMLVDVIDDEDGEHVQVFVE